MALPIIVAPEYTTNLPSNGLEVKYRPFLVKEEKLLLFAAESGEKEDMINSVCQMMSNCVISPELDPYTLPYFDFEYLFLHIRSKSVGETAEFQIKHDKEECEHMNTVTVRLDEIINKTDDDHTDKIDLTEEISVKMKYPTINSVKDMMNISADNILNIFADSIEYAYDKETVYDEFTGQESVEFLESLSKEQFDKITNFFNTMPVSRLEVKYKCEKCEENVETLISGFEDFFT
jgi:hypothetical protein